MRILQTPVRFYPFIGGVENYVYNLSTELIKLDHNVTVVCANEPICKNNELIKKINVIRIPYIGKIANTNITPKLPILIFKKNFDIIHTHIPTPWCADWSAIITEFKRKPLILTYHNDIVADGFANYIAKFYNLTSLKFVLSKAAKIIITQPNYMASSPYLRKYKNKVEVIPNGVNVNRFSPMNVEKSDNTLFFLSVLDKFHKYKGLDKLLQALVIVKKEIKDVKLIVGGTGELLKYYKQKTISLGLKQNVFFTGFISDEKIVEYYNKCDAFVLPSISAKQEGFGIVLLEAMACEKPIITTGIVGVANEAIDNNAGIVVPTKDTKMLANAIIKVLEDDNTAKMMGKNGRKLVENKYSWEKVAKMMDDVYRGLA